MAKIGRPTKYKKEMCQTMLDLFNGGATVVEVCAELGIAKDTFYNWVKEHQEFSDSYKKGMVLAEAWWTKIGRAGMLGKTKTPFVYPIWMFFQKCRFGWDDKPKIEIVNETPQRIEIKLVDELGEDEQ